MDLRLQEIPTTTTKKTRPHSFMSPATGSMLSSLDVLLSPLSPSPDIPHTHTHTLLGLHTQVGICHALSALLNKQNYVSQQRTGHQIKSQGVPLMPIRAVVPFK